MSGFGRDLASNGTSAIDQIDRIEVSLCTRGFGFFIVHRPCRTGTHPKNSSVLDARTFDQPMIRSKQQHGEGAEILALCP